MSSLTRRRVMRQRKSVSSSAVSDRFVAANDAELTAYSSAGIRRAALPDLLVRALAIGDDPPVEGMIIQVAEDMKAVCDLIDLEHPAFRSLLTTWSTRLRIIAEVHRRERGVTP